MRLLIMGNNLGMGGAQTAFRMLTKFCCEERHQVAAIALQSKNTAMLVEGTHSSTIIDAEARSLIAKCRKYMRLILAVRRARRFTPDVFISVGLAKSANFIARALNGKTFSVAQDFIHGRRIDDPLLVDTLNTFCALAVQSPSMITTLQNQSSRSLPLNWLPCFPESSCVELIHEPTSIVSGIKLAYFGRLASNKGLPMLLNAFGAAQFVADASLDIWGDGDVREELRQLIDARGLQGRIRLMGRYPFGEEGTRLMCSYHGVVLSSTENEGLPLILLEAMAQGIPFLTTNVGAIPDCCHNNQDCMLVAPEMSVLSKGIDRFVVSLKEGRFSRERLRSYFETHYSPEVMTKRWRLMLEDPSGFFSSHA